MKYPLLFPILSFAFGILAALPARAETADLDALVASSERALERALLRASTTDVEAAAQPLDAALASDPKNPALLYMRAFAHYALTPSLRTAKDKEPLAAEFDKAVALLERVKGQPWEGEAAALHSSILGELIGIRGGMSGMTLGPKSSQLMARAAKSIPNSPRLLMFEGISLLNTPKTWGGDPVAGAKDLQQAVDMFAAADSATHGPYWGQASALTWLGIAKKGAGDLAGARVAWEAALKIEPDYGWVKFVLLPSLDQNAKN